PSGFGPCSTLRFGCAGSSTRRTHRLPNRLNLSLPSSLCNCGLMKILWLKTELLHPVDKGGKIRSYNMLKELKRSCHITYLTLDDGTADNKARELANEYCHDLVCIPHRRREKFTKGFYVELALNLASDLPYAIKKYES